MADPIRLRALRRAVELAGGAAPLAEHLGVPAATVQRWAAAKAPIPDEAFESLGAFLLAKELALLGARGGERR